MTNLEQKSREKRQTHSYSLLPYVLVSLLIHGLLALLIVFQQRSSLVTKQQQQQDNAPIEFIIVPPEETTDRPPPETTRRAVNNSIAQGKVKSEQPPTTEKKGDTAIDSSPVSTPEVAPSQSDTKPSEKVKPTPPVASKPEPVQSPQPPTPTNSEPQAIAPSPSVESPTDKSPVEETPTNSSAASLLGGTYQRSIEEDGGSSFFDSEALAEKEGPYAQLDAQQDDLARYFEEIRRRVKRNWQPLSPGDDRNTVIAFAIEPNGQITGLRIVETSGKERVDRDALEAIEKSAPFDPLPQSFKRDRLEIQFNFNIYIHQGSFSPNLAIPYP